MFWKGLKIFMKIYHKIYKKNCNILTFCILLRKIKKIIWPSKCKYEPPLSKYVSVNSKNNKTRQCFLSITTCNCRIDQNRAKFELQTLFYHNVTSNWRNHFFQLSCDLSVASGIFFAQKGSRIRKKFTSISWGFLYRRQTDR